MAWARLAYRKMDEAEEVRFGGRIVDHWVDGHNKPEHVGYTTVLAIPRDMEIAGYKTNHTNTLRLWDAKSPVPVRYVPLLPG